MIASGDYAAIGLLHELQHARVDGHDLRPAKHYELIGRRLADYSPHVFGALRAIQLAVNFPELLLGYE